MPKTKQPLNDAERNKEAARILDRLEGESETVGASSMVRVTKQLSENAVGTNPEELDPIEILGKRIGRGLGIIAIIALLYHLVTTYLI